MLDFVRTSLHRAITTRVGDALLPVRLPKDLARRMNALLGEPLCSRSELAARREAGATLAELRRTKKADAAEVRGAAPVMVYFEKDRNTRTLGRIEEALTARSIPFTKLEVDEATKAYVMREARVKEDELPIVFVAGTPVGDYNALVDWDVSGRLAKAVFGGG